MGITETTARPRHETKLPYVAFSKTGKIPHARATMIARGIDLANKDTGRGNTDRGVAAGKPIARDVTTSPKTPGMRESGGGPPKPPDDRPTGGAEEPRDPEKIARLREEKDHASLNYIVAKSQMTDSTPIKEIPGIIGQTLSTRILLDDAKRRLTEAQGTAEAQDNQSRAVRQTDIYLGEIFRGNPKLGELTTDQKRGLARDLIEISHADYTWQNRKPYWQAVSTNRTQAAHLYIQGKTLTEIYEELPYRQWGENSLALHIGATAKMLLRADFSGRLTGESGKGVLRMLEKWQKK